MTTTTKPTHILWDITNRNHWERAFVGTLEECEKELDELTEGSGYGYEIHANEIKDSWNNVVEGTHYDTYMDDSTEDRPMTKEEIESEK